MTKSLPSAATDEHNMGLRKTRRRACGLQTNFTRLSIGVGARGKTVKFTFSVVGMARSHRSNSVFPSVPVLAFSVYVPGGRKEPRRSSTESVSKAELQPIPVTLVIDTFPGETKNSDPVDVKLEHLIFLLSFNRMISPPQLASA